MVKKQLGQFFTTNADYILQNLEKYVKGKEATDPFAGGGDLIKWAKKNGVKKIKGFDVDKKLTDGKFIFHNDSILNPQKYKFILTNPPYLNINKANNPTKKKYFTKSGLEDLYQVSLSSLMDSEEGIAIVPINFLSAENSRKIRNLFFHKFEIIEMNYFKQQVFPDTTYNVIAFYYKKKKDIFENEFTIKTRVYPEIKKTDIKLKKEFNWTIGGEILSQIKKQENTLGIYRLTEDHLIFGNKEVRAAYNHIKDVKTLKVSERLYEDIKKNIILLRAIDSGTDKGKIRLENINNYDLECLISKESSRNMVYLVFRNQISVAEQEKIINLFNFELSKLRESYMSLFLTNFRDNDRKRISFDFTYKFINNLYFGKIEKPNISIQCNKKQQLSFA